MRKIPRRTIFEIIVITIGFFGIDFFWNLQYANMSGIYYFLGVSTSVLPLLGIPGSVVGLIVPPIIGKVSDNTWCMFGRRKPYFFIGGLIGCIAIFCMPLSKSLVGVLIFTTIAAIALNICVASCMAYISDSLMPEQIVLGYSVQSIMLAIAATTAAIMPWVFKNIFKVHSAVTAHEIPASIRLSYSLGAIVLICAIVITVLVGPEEYPVEQAKEKSRIDITGFFKDLFYDFIKMPSPIRHLNFVVFFVWAGLSVMFTYLPLDVAIRIYGGKDHHNLFEAGIEWTGVCFSAYSVISFFAALFIPMIAKRISKKTIFLCTNIFGFIGLAMIPMMTQNYHIFFAMAGIGIMVAGIFIIPYAVIAEVMPRKKHGSYMGITNVFVTLPAIIIGFLIGPLMKYLFKDNTVIALVIAAAFILIASLVTTRIDSRLH